MTEVAGWPDTFCILCDKKLTKEHLRNGLPSACPYCGVEDNGENAWRLPPLPDPGFMERSRD
jgi:hypothetical protein